jgi:hypothetical protein
MRVAVKTASLVLAALSLSVGLVKFIKAFQLDRLAAPRAEAAVATRRLQPVEEPEGAEIRVDSP